MYLLRCQGIRDGAACPETVLCEAHIVPRAFAKVARGASNRMLTISDDSGVRNAKTPNGVFDREILCRGCDGALGVYDKYGIEFARAFPESHTPFGRDGWQVNDVDHDRLLKFYLAVLWRASLSSRPEFSDVRLGPYECRARDVLFGTLPLASLPAFQIMLARLTTSVARMDGFFDLPTRLQRHWGRNGYVFILGSFYVIAKLDNRPFPYPQRAFTVASPIVRGTFQRFEDTSQFRVMAQQILKRSG